jgi:COP9 signalosome complex subunit 7
MIDVLVQWQGQCGVVIGSVEAEIAKIKADAERKRAKEKDRMARVERSVAGWDGENDDDAASAGGAVGGGPRQWLRSSKESGSSGRRLNFGSGGRSSSNLGSSNKREFNATNDAGEDYEHWGHGDGGMDTAFDGSKMDVDEGPGAAGGTGGGASKMTTTGAARQAKRLLGTGGRS